MRQLVRALLTAAVVVVALAPAVDASPAAPRVSGTVTGTGRHGDVLTFRVVAADRSGFGHLDIIRIALQLHSVILDEVTYERTHNEVATSSSLPVPAGTRATVTGTFLSVNARDVEIRGSGDRLSLSLRARVLQDIPRGSSFSLGASDDVNLVTWVTRSVTVPEPPHRGFSWGTLALAVVVALFAGGFVGNLFAGRRPGEPKVSVYDAMRARIERERQDAGHAG